MLRRLKDLFKFKRLWMVIGAIFLLFIIAVCAWLIMNTKPIPGKFRQGLNYPLYYPANLPNGYSVNSISFQRRGDILIFSIKAPNNKNVAVSEEHIPLGLDLSQHPSGAAGIKLPDEDNITTSAGSAQTSFWGDKYVTSLVTPNTWIIINVTGLTNTQARIIAQSFHPL